MTSLGGSLSYSVEAANRARLDRRAQLMEWDVKPNPYPNPEAGGHDAFMATTAEIPGLVALGATKEDALDVGRRLATLEYLAASPEQARRMDAVQAHVQFNHRISAEEKALIVQRAAEANLSVRQFMLNQCLLAPIVKTMPKEEVKNKVKRLAERLSDARKSQLADENDEAIHNPS